MQAAAQQLLEQLPQPGELAAMEQAWERLQGLVGSWT